MQRNNPAKTKITLIICGFFLFFILLEIGIRAGGFIFSSLQEYKNKVSIRKNGSYKIMCLGESTTARQYPGPLEEILNKRNIGIRFSVIDKGVIAANTNDILSQLEMNLDNYKPDMVITMMGYNDKWIMFYKDIPESNTKLFRNCRTYRFLRLIYIHILKKLKKEDIYSQGIGRLRLGDNDELINAGISLRKALELNPKNDQVYIGLGCINRNQGDLIHSEEYFRKAIELNPKNDQAYIGLGSIYRNQGDLIHSEEYFRKALELSPNNEWACSELAQVYKRQGNFYQAENILKEYVERYPNKNWGYKILESLYREMGREELAKECNKKLKELNIKEYTFLTIHNYNKLKQILDKRGIKLVCVQYPMRSIESLRGVFEDQGGIIFVDNKRLFNEAVQQDGYKEYFVDMFGGDFGHCTSKGNRFLAKNIANTILKEVFGK